MLRHRRWVRGHELRVRRPGTPAAQLPSVHYKVLRGGARWPLRARRALPPRRGRGLPRRRSPRATSRRSSRAPRSPASTPRSASRQGRPRPSSSRSTLIYTRFFYNLSAAAGRHVRRPAARSTRWRRSPSGSPISSEEDPHGPYPVRIAILALVAACAGCPRTSKTRSASHSTPRSNCPDVPADVLREDLLSTPGCHSTADKMLGLAFQAPERRVAARRRARDGGRGVAVRPREPVEEHPLRKADGHAAVRHPDAVQRDAARRRDGRLHLAMDHHGERADPATAAGTGRRRGEDSSDDGARVFRRRRLDFGRRGNRRGRDDSGRRQAAGRRGHRQTEGRSGPRSVGSLDAAAPVDAKAD